MKSEIGKEKPGTLLEDGKWRVETDSMGAVKVPAERLWGAQTQRALENFQISGLRMPREFIRALGLIKWAAATTNLDLDGLDLSQAKLDELLAVDPSVWIEEAALSARDLARLGDHLPEALLEEQAALEQRLASAA